MLTTYVLPTLRLRPLARLTPLDIQELVDLLIAANLGPRTIRYTVGILRQAFGQAVRWRLLSSSPVEAGTLTLPRQVKVERQWLTPETVKQLLAAATDDRLSALWHVAVVTGLRPGEFRGLKSSDIDFDKRILRVRRSLSVDAKRFSQPKTPRSFRTVTLPGSTVQALRKHRRLQAEEKIAAGPKNQDQGLVFCTHFGRPFEHNNLGRQHFLPLHKRAGLPRIRLYDLRHTSASLLLEAGENIKVVSERLGHSSITLTADVYSHVSPALQAKTADRLEELLAMDA